MENGSAHRVGEGTVHGHSVFWLQMHMELSRPPGADRTPDPIDQRVAIDQETYKPIVVEPLHGGTSYDVVDIGTVSSDAADFSQPVQTPPEQRMSSGNVIDSQEIGLSAARSVLGRDGLWAGHSIGGLELTKVSRETLRMSYARTADLPPHETTGLSLEYGSGLTSLKIQEATEPAFAYGWPQPDIQWPLPPAGFVRIAPFDWGFVVRDEVYVKITSSQGEDAVVAAARALEVIPSA